MKLLLAIWHAVHKPRYKHASTAAPQFILGGLFKSVKNTRKEAGTVSPDASGNIQQANISKM
jgi:hypothetical protein